MSHKSSKLSEAAKRNREAAKDRLVEYIKLNPGKYQSEIIKSIDLPKWKTTQLFKELVAEGRIVEYANNGQTLHYKAATPKVVPAAVNNQAQILLSLLAESEDKIIKLEKRVLELEKVAQKLLTP